MESKDQPAKSDVDALMQDKIMQTANSALVKKSKKVEFVSVAAEDSKHHPTILMVATDAIKAGEVILEEKPILSAPIAEFYDKVCHVCMKENPNVQRCSGCKYSHYCSQDHQVADWTQSHKKECSYLKKISEKFPGKPLNHVVVLIVKILVRYYDIPNKDFQEIFNHLPPLKEPSKRTKELCSKVNETILEIEGRNQAIQAEELTLYTLRVLENSVLLQGKKNMDDWIASGIFPITKKIQHDCCPNSFSATNPGLSHRTVAARNIEKGQRITISYVDQDQDVKWRRSQLLEGFSMKCECKRCTEEEGVAEKLTSPFLANKGYYTAPKTLAEIEKYVADCKEALPEHNYAWFRALEVLTEPIKKLGLHEYYYGLLQFMLPKYEHLYRGCGVGGVSSTERTD